MPKRIVAAEALEYRTELPDGPILRAYKGETVDFPAEEIARLEEQTVGGHLLVPEQFETFEEFRDYIQAVYRGERGDPTSVARLGQIAEARAGKIENLSDPQGASLATRIEAGLNVEETIALAGDDPGKADAVLAAEHEATGGEPRTGVVTALEKLKAKAEE